MIINIYRQLKWETRIRKNPSARKEDAIFYLYYLEKSIRVTKNVIVNQSIIYEKFIIEFVIITTRF